MKKHFARFPKGIRFKLISIMLLLFMLFAGISTYVWYSYLTTEATNTSVNNIQTMMQISNENFETSLSDINNVVVLISADLGNHINDNICNYLLSDNVKSDAELLQYRRDAEDYITSLCNFKTYLNGLAVYDLKGNSLNYGPTMQWSDVQKQPWYKKLLSGKNEEIFIPPHFYSQYRQNNGDSVFSIARAIKHDGKTIGYVIADIKTSMLEDMFDIQNINGYSLYVVDDESDCVVYSPNKDSSAVISEFKQLSKRFKSKTNYCFANLNGRENLIVYKHSKFTNWDVIGFVPKSIVISSYIAASNQVIFIVASCGIVCIALIFLISSALTKNLRLLTKAVSNINKSNLDLPVCINSDDETGQLYQQIKFMIRRIQILIADIKKAENEKRKSEIQALQAQINPHFLYNTLNTIKFLAVIQGIDNIKEVSESLSNMLHVNLDYRKFVPICDETAYLQNYIKIQEYRYSDKFTLQFIIDDDVKNKYISKLLVQPLVENAIRHGIAPKTGQGVIQVRIFAENKTLKIIVKDNGVGIASEKLNDILTAAPISGHIGIANIESRIRMIFGKNYGLTILSEEGLYTIAEIHIPLISEDELPLYD